MTILLVEVNDNVVLDLVYDRVTEQLVLKRIGCPKCDKWVDMAKVHEQCLSVDCWITCSCGNSIFVHRGNIEH